MSDNITLLYVEDCEVTVELLKLNMDRYWPYSSLCLDVTDSVSMAKEVYSSDKHDAALIDWNLPDGIAPDVARHIRSLHKTIPIIFLSSAITDDLKVEADNYCPHLCMGKGHGKEYINSIAEYITSLQK